MESLAQLLTAIFGGVATVGALAWGIWKYFDEKKQSADDGKPDITMGTPILPDWKQEWDDARDERDAYLHELIRQNLDPHLVLSKYYERKHAHDSVRERPKQR